MDLMDRMDLMDEREGCFFGVSESFEMGTRFLHILMIFCNILGLHILRIILLILWSKINDNGKEL
jgi:phage shock protein PspC (stress-responsive transcriptional regulator)